MDISIIIPNYNGADLLKKNLPKVVEAVRAYKDGKVEIIIPDDASSDNSEEVILDFIGSIKEQHIIGKTVKNNDRKNGGFSANINRGVRASTGEILLFINSDVIPHKDFLAPLLERFSDPMTFAVGCMDESIEDGKPILRGRGVGKWARGFLTHQAGSVDKENTLWVSGGSGAFRKDIYVKLGGLNNIYNPFYWEDIDLSYRAQKAGYKVFFEKKSIVVHEHSKGAIKTFFKPFRVQKIAYRNQFYFIWLNITDISLLISHIFWLPYYFVKTAMKRDWAFAAGFFAALQNLPEVLQLRGNTIKYFSMTDKEVLSQLI